LTSGVSAFEDVGRVVEVGLNIEIKVASAA
jgi:hypothetical protein